MIGNQSLIAISPGFGACPVAGIHYDGLARELGVHAREEPAVYTVMLGQKSADHEGATEAALEYHSSVFGCSEPENPFHL